MADPNGDPRSGAGVTTGARTAARHPAGPRVLIVDDSQVVRRLVREAISGASGYRVVGEAANGREAISLSKELQPDVMVLDLMMPVMDGFRTLESLRSMRSSVEVVVFANVSPDDIERVDHRVRAAGARLVVKPVGVADADEAVVEVRGRLLAAIGQTGSPAEPQPEKRPAKPRAMPIINAVLIASSTGGPNALEAVLGSIGELRVPVFIVQHISEGFSSRLASRLDSLCPFPVREAADGDHPEPGHVYISPGGVHMVVERGDHGLAVRLNNSPPVNSCRPSADVLFRSTSEIYGANQLGVVLTGIGQDGLDGCRDLVRLGAPVLVQDEDSSVVWGMPGAVATADLADEILPLRAIGSRIERLTALRSPTRRRRDRS